jgi:hypothetical protein
MKFKHWILFYLLLSAALVSTAGDIQISCQPDLRIYLDEKFMGTSNTMEDGLFLAGVAPGAHTIRVEKDGFLPKNIRIEVSDYPIEVRVGTLSPQPFAQYQKKKAEPEEVKQLFGELIITSAPQNCVIEVDGKSEPKETPELAIGRIEAGRHTISFSKPGYETITREITIHPGAEVTVRGDLFAGKIDVIYKGKGSLQVLSNPNRCTVRFRGKIEEKIHSKLNLTHIPAGEYPIIFEIKGRSIARNVLIKDGQRAVVSVNFVKGEEPFSVSYVPH